MPESDPYRARLAVLTCIRDTLERGIRGRTYAVVRGAVNYTAWDYEARPFVAALIAADFPIRPAGGDFFRSMDVAIELSTSVPDSPEGPQDSILDAMAKDAELILAALEAARNDQDDPIIIGIDTAEGTEPRCREMYGPGWRVQGLELTFSVDY